MKAFNFLIIATLFWAFSFNVLAQVPDIVKDDKIAIKVIKNLFDGDETCQFQITID